MNVILHTLAHVSPFRDYFLRELNYSHIKPPPGDQMFILGRWSCIMDVPIAFVHPRRMRCRVTVLGLCVSVSVCYHASCHVPRFLCPKWSVIWFFMLFLTHVLCWFCWKRFVQKFWCHLLSTTAILASWRALHRQKRQRGILFNKTTE